MSPPAVVQQLDGLLAGREGSLTRTQSLQCDCSIKADGPVGSAAWGLQTQSGELSCTCSPTTGTTLSQAWQRKSQQARMSVHTPLRPAASVGRPTDPAPTPTCQMVKLEGQR